MITPDEIDEILGHIYMLIRQGERESEPSNIIRALKRAASDLDDAFEAAKRHEAPTQ